MQNMNDEPKMGLKKDESFSFIHIYFLVYREIFWGLREGTNEVKRSWKRRNGKSREMKFGLFPKSSLPSTLITLAKVSGLLELSFAFSIVIGKRIRDVKSKSKPSSKGGRRKTIPFIILKLIWITWSFLWVLFYWISCFSFRVFKKILLRYPPQYWLVCRRRWNKYVLFFLYWVFILREERCLLFCLHYLRRYKEILE